MYKDMGVRFADFSKLFSHPYQLDESISNFRVVGVVFAIYIQNL